MGYRTQSLVNVFFSAVRQSREMERIKAAVTIMTVDGDFTITPVISQQENDKSI